MTYLRKAEEMEMKETEIKEEKSIAPIVNDFEGIILNGLGFGKRLLKWVLASFIDFFSFCVKNALWLIIAVLIGGTAAYFSFSIFPKKYDSSLSLELNIDSKTQLKNDISYIDNLISNGDTKSLNDLFGLSDKQSESLKACKLIPITTQIEKVNALNDIRYKTDTVIYNKLELNELLKQKDDRLTNRFSIVFTATDNEVFSHLEDSLMKFLSSSPELQSGLATEIIKLKSKSEFLQSELVRLDTIEAANLRYLEAINFEEVDTAIFSAFVNPLELQDRRINFHNEINYLEGRLLRFKQPYFVVSHLNEVGKEVSWSLTKRIFYAGLVSFFFALIILLMVQKKRD